MTTLFSFLGTGNYFPATYEWTSDDGTSSRLETRFASHAVAGTLGPMTAVRIVATEAAWSTHGASLLEALPNAQRLPIPDGRTPDELWQMFSSLEAALRALPEEEAVVVDVTHGFRIQPLFVMSILTQLRATGWKNALTVVYGAWDARVEDLSGTHPPITPIWDLTSVVELVDWALGLKILLETGRAEPVSEAVRLRGTAMAKAWATGGREGPRPSLDQLGKALANFGADLETLRLGSLLGAHHLHSGKPPEPSTVAWLRETLGANRPLVKRALPVLDRSFDRLEEILARLDGGPLETLACEEGHRRLVALGELYLTFGRYAETMVVAREGRVLRFASPAAGQPGVGFDPLASSQAERRMSGERDPVVDVRNDIQHGGLRKGPKPASTLRDASHKAIEQLRETPAAYRSPDARQPPPERLVVNVSHHPAAEWPEKMCSEVGERFGAIVDLAMPELREDDELEGLVASLVSEVVARGASVALVFGEPVLCYAIVSALGAVGVASYAPITRREVEHLDDGRLARAFDYRGLRPYPSR